jgi:hypothetical protein
MPTRPSPVPSSCPQAEKIAARMASEGRVKATIDQVDGVIDFVPQGADEQQLVGALLEWDEGIKDFCSRLNALAEKITKRGSA